MNEGSGLIIQETGLTRLQPSSEFNQLNQWMYDRISPYLMGNILEIGSGNGDKSSILWRNKVQVTLSNSNFDLTSKDFETEYNDLLYKFDCVVALNVKDYKPMDKLSVINFKKLIAPGGYLILLRSIHIALYKGLYSGLRHWHNQNKTEINNELLPHEFNIIKVRYFNIIGLIGWFLSTADTRFDDDAENEQYSYNAFVPTFRIEDLSMNPIGLSAIVVAKKINEYNK